MGVGSGSGPGLAAAIILCPVANGAGNSLGRVWHRGCISYAVVLISLRDDGESSQICCPTAILGLPGWKLVIPGLKCMLLSME